MRQSLGLRPIFRRAGNIRLVAPTESPDMNNDVQAMLLGIALVLAASVGAADSAEPAFKQEPAENLWSYVVKTPLPNYPTVAATWHKKGGGWFRLNINPATGSVTDVKVLKSTGTKVLDDSVAVACLQWKIKPHTIDHIVLPFYFRGMGESTGTHIKW